MADDEDRERGQGEETYADTGEVRKLGVSVDVHLDDTVLDGGLDLVLAGTGTAVEDEEAGGGLAWVENTVREEGEVGRRTHSGLVSFAWSFSSAYSWCFWRSSGWSLTLPGL